MPKKKKVTQADIRAVRRLIDERIEQFAATRRLSAEDFSVVINARDTDPIGKASKSKKKFGRTEALLKEIGSTRNIRAEDMNKIVR